MDAKMIARKKIAESNHGNDSALTNATPRQSQHQGVKLRSAQTEPVSGTSRRPDEVALVQSSSGQPDADTVMHQHLHAVSASVGKEVGGVGVGGTEDLDDPGQSSVGACPHVHRHGCQPYGINPDHANHSRSHCAQAALSCAGQLTTILVPARCTSMRMSGGVGSSGCGVADGGCAVTVTGINASC